MFKDPPKILIIGSGGLKIGQAGEFDYSGSQAIKALKEEGYTTILVNPNIATVQTDQGLADKVYFQPLNIQTLTKIIEKERPASILLSVGGQTALNLGLELEKEGVLEKWGVQVLGTPTEAIRISEDRELFRRFLESIDVKTPKSFCVTDADKAVEAAKEIGFPIMLRAGFSLGGLGSGKIENEVELKQRARQALTLAPQILIEEYLFGWKELEYEILRDAEDNALIVCNMENLDPMGIHTGESIVVAPSQTLSNAEYHLLREVAIKTVKALKIVGECNIQYALDPKTGDYRVIELNARLSRSSALASKATGYPIAFIATKLCLGKKLYELKNAVTKKTSAFFEPALDYVAVKIPRWDTNKFKTADRKIGSEMKSVGEVMAIGRTFPEALQKAIRMLNIGASGLTDYPFEIANVKEEVTHATDRRLFALFRYFQEGGDLEEAHKFSQIDFWFLNHIALLAQFADEISKKDLLAVLKKAKKMGFSDKGIAKIKGLTEDEVRSCRIQHGIVPVVKQIDTLAGEFDAETNYLYMSYNAEHNDLSSCDKHPVIILGSGPYCIGSSVEFDWCAVNMARTLTKLGEAAIIINSNPETVSTDYDESERLYFEELTLERVQDIADFESSKGLIVSVGGQIANNLALLLYKRGYKILGTSPVHIDQAENRHHFSNLLQELGIDQPVWIEAGSCEAAKAFAEKIGFPLLVRPSYVLSGAAMNTVYSLEELERYFRQAQIVSPEHPIVLSQFILNAKELEIDGVAEQGKVVIDAFLEHVENAGVHSGDATLVLPPQKLYLETIRKGKKIAAEIAKALAITGPFNIQFIAKDNELKVIECNLRAARSFPFVSKATNYNFIAIATEAIMGKLAPKSYETLELDYVCVKTPQFSYSRLKGSNPVAHVEMASTGEVACIGESFLEAFFMSWHATEQRIKGKRVLVSIGGDKKEKVLSSLKQLEERGWEILATENTHEFLIRNGVASHFVYKASDGVEPNVKTAIMQHEIDLIINIPRSYPTGTLQSDGSIIRRLAIDHNIPLITNLQIAQVFLQSLVEVNLEKLAVKSWQEFVYQK